MVNRKIANTIYLYNVIQLSRSVKNQVIPVVPEINKTSFSPIYIYIYIYIYNYYFYDYSVQLNVMES